MSIGYLAIRTVVDVIYAGFVTAETTGSSTSAWVDDYIEGANSIAIVAFNKGAGIGIIFAFIVLGILIGSCIACCICCGGCCQCCRPKSDQTIRYFSQAPPPYHQPYNQPANQPINQSLIA